MFAFRRLSTNLSTSTSSTLPDTPSLTTVTQTLQQKLSHQPISQTPHARNFLTTSTLHRYLHVTNLSIEKAYSAILSTLQWRAAYRPDTLYHHHHASLRAEAATGKMFVIAPTALHASSTIVMRPGLETTSDAHVKLRYIVYTLERAARLSESGRIVAVIDHNPGRLSMATMPSFAMLKMIVMVLQKHYPGRLETCFFVDMPAVIGGVVRGLKPFLEERTRRKLRFVRGGVGEDLVRMERFVDVGTILGEGERFDVEDYFAGDEVEVKR